MTRSWLVGSVGTSWNWVVMVALLGSGIAFGWALHEYRHQSAKVLVGRERGEAYILRSGQVWYLDTWVQPTPEADVLEKDPGGKPDILAIAEEYDREKQAGNRDIVDVFDEYDREKRDVLKVAEDYYREKREQQTAPFIARKVQLAR